MTENYSLWDKLKNTDKPIIIYGTGNGADKIFDVLDKYGIHVSAVFASDGFVRERIFRGYPVRSYNEIIDEYGNGIIVLLAFGTTLPDVTKLIQELDRKHELIIPDVPLYSGDLFDYGYFIAHKQSLEKACYELFDELSKKIFSDAVNFRLTGKLCYLIETERTEDTLKDLFKKSTINSVLDGGAFKGDSTSVFAEVFSPDIIYSVEADSRTYKKLCDYAEKEKKAKVYPVNAALSDKNGTVEYVSSSSRGSGENGKNKRGKTVVTDCRTIDNILAGKEVDLIKLDVEGDERAALDGARETIKKYEPSLSVSLYHRTDDLFELIQYVHQILPSHKLYLRRVPCIPLWDLVLYAIKQK